MTDTPVAVPGDLRSRLRLHKQFPSKVEDEKHDFIVYLPPGSFGGNLDTRLLKPSVVDYLARNRHSCVLWNAIPEDWSHPTTWVPRALELCQAQPHALVVLHDLPTGAMKLLDRFIEEAKAQGARFTQEFPAACVPMEQGRLVRPIDDYLTIAA